MHQSLFYCLSLKYSSTCFGHHHQELINCSSRLWNGQQHCYHHVPTVNQRRLLQLISSSCPSSRAYQLQQPPLVYRWNVVVAVLLVVVGPDRPRPTALSPSSDGKPDAGTSVVVAPDDGHENARNMLSCI
jgi:hypothetical protein